MRKIFFIHIMKTGGTSFRKALLDSLGNEVYPTDVELRENPKGWYLNNHQILEAKKQGRLMLNERRIVCGHYPYVIGAKILSDPFYATFLRDPIDRTLSMIAHHQKTSPVYKNATISEMLDNQRYVRRQIENYQTKIFALDHLKQKTVNTGFKVSDKDISLALDRMQSMDYIGITEQFESSLKLFENKTGVVLKKELHLNMGVRHEHASEDELHRIKELVYYDNIFYQEAKIRFLSECSQYLD